MLHYIEIILLTLLSVSLIGYILVVIKEKIHLRDNMIVLDNKSITQEHIDETDIKEFALGGKNVKAGDEVQVILKGNKRVEGIIIGAKKKENEILMITHNDEIENFKVDRIMKFKIISKYGKFFNLF